MDDKGHSEPSAVTLCDRPDLLSTGTRQSRATLLGLVFHVSVSLEPLAKTRNSAYHAVKPILSPPVFKIGR
jgi:hypothetical protein